MKNCTIENNGQFKYTNRRGMNCSANFPLTLIRKAWDRGADYEDLADGFGLGEGTYDDWSGIRDSSPGQINLMFERAWNHLFPEDC